jgi:D-serine deaminase-like pyridoxal phosphate-dependent protein
MWTDSIERPTLMLDAAICQANIKRMAEKARAQNIRFRPHSKTHQAQGIAQWIRNCGVDCITVSSVEMAEYFAKYGWIDITIAFTANPRQVKQINRLAADGVRLGLLVESVDCLQLLQRSLEHPVDVWLDIDTGYHRTGLPWDAMDEIHAVAQATVQDVVHFRLRGLLTHAGETYDVHGVEAVTAIQRATVYRLKATREALEAKGIGSADNKLELSIGDTPSCSMVHDLGPIDEMRPGNFVFFDVMQANIGACRLEEIAVALACPVVGKQPHLNQIVLYGGAVHLSKDRIIDSHGRKSFGRIAKATTTGWSILPDTYYLKSVSQEHGLVHADTALIDSVKIGDILLVLPIHSCLAANLNKCFEVLNNDATTISMAPIPDVSDKETPGEKIL